MSKKGKVGLGRSLIKDRFGATKGKKFVSNNSMLHTTEIQDGYDWGRLNLQSVTEESSFQEFLSTAELAGTEFQAEKLNIKFINPRSNVGLLSFDEKKKADEGHEKNKELLKIPRRPPWTSETTSEELQRNEKEQFLEWRRSLAKLQEEDGLLLTPYEKNLEFWRQLWRVVERSDVVIQIVDARNPLLFRCEDLEKYVKEVSKDKVNLILINKADFLDEFQRQCWCNYFDSVGVKVAFYSAALAAEAILEEEHSDGENKTEEFSEDSEPESNVHLNAKLEDIKEEHIDEINQIKCDITKLEQSVERTAEKLNEVLNDIKKTIEEQGSSRLKNSPELLTREGLVNLFRTIHQGSKVTSNVTTIGLVGYPNVGKSSTINSLMRAKKVSVSATPGKTKHFQTLFLDTDILLCDCPGLVMPSFVYTKAEMIVNGILPIDQMRDHVPPINLVTSQIPRHIVEDKYGIMLPMPMEGEDQERNPTAEELLNAYGFNRGFMTANGQPDNARSARYILKDYVIGKLLYAMAPPDMQQSKYHQWPQRQRELTERVLPPREIRAVKPNKLTAEDLDKMFFNTGSKDFHSKGILGKAAGLPISTRAHNDLGDSVETLIMEKPWKKINKHGNKKKKEKLRRVYSHLDQH